MSPPQRQTVVFPLIAGIDTKSDDRTTPMGRLQALENAVFTRPGSIRKRFGTQYLPKTISNVQPVTADRTPLTAVEEGLGLASYKNELCLWDPARMYSYDVGSSAWVDKGPMVSARVTQDPVIRNVWGQSHADGTTHAASGLQMHAWEDGNGGVRYSIIDAPTGQVVVASTLVSLTGSRPKTLAVGNNLLVIWIEDSGSAPVLNGATVPVAAPTTTLVPYDLTGSSGSDWRQLNPTTPSYDACVIHTPGDLSEHLYLAFNSNSASTGVTVYAYNQTDLTSPFGSEHTTFEAIPMAVITIFPSSRNYYWGGPVIAGWTGSQVRAICFAPFNTTTTQTLKADDAYSTGAQNVTQITGTAPRQTNDAGNWRIAYTENSIAATTVTTTHLISYIDGGQTVTTLMGGVSLAAKAWGYNEIAYFPIIYNSPLSSTQFVVDEYSNIVMRALSGVAGVDAASANYLATGTATIGGNFSDTSIVSVIVGGVSYESPDGLTTLAEVAAAIAALINASATDATATSVGEVIYITAVALGAAGEAVTLSSFSDSGLTVTLSGANLVLPEATPSYAALLPETTAIDPGVPVEITAPTAATGQLVFSGVTGTVGATIGGYTVTIDATGLTDAQAVVAWVAAANADPFVGPLVVASGSVSPIILTDAVSGAPNPAITVVAVGTGVSTPNPTLTGGTDGTYTYPSNPNWRWDALIKSFLSTFPATTTTGTATTATFTENGVTSLNFEFFSATNSYISNTLGDTLNVGGGFISMYDGVKPVELGFHVFPELADGDIVTATTGGSLGNASQETTYWWSVCYSWTDNNGAIHRSAPSIPISKTFASGVTTGSATITLPTLFLTAKGLTGTPLLSAPDSVVMEVYRTIGTSPGIFYLCNDSSAPASSPAANRSIVNDRTVPTVTFLDVNVSDAEIIGNPRLYTTGNVLENTPPPPCNSLIVYQNRIFGIDSTNPLVLFYSQQIIPGSPVEFSDFLTINLDPAIGEALALGVMDEKLVIFGEANTYWMNGSGPDATGAANGYQQPQLIPGTTGCANPKSVVSLDDGTAFQSPKGLYMLTRGLQMVYAGAMVEQQVLGNTITSAQDIPTTNQVRFTIDTGDTVVWDTLVNQWSVFSDMGPVDALIWLDTYVSLNSSGQVIQEAPDAYSDNAAPIQTSLTTGPIRLSTIAGYQRVRLVTILGTFETPHELEVSFMFDGDPSSVQTITVSPEAPTTWGASGTWGSSQVWGGSYWTPYIYRCYLNRQKCESVQVTIRDLQEGVTPGAGMSLNALAFEIAVTRGTSRVPATSTYGG